MQKSLRQDLSTRIGLVILSISIGIGLVYYALSVRIYEKEFNHHIENQTRGIANTFTLQLWLFDLTTTRELCKLILEGQAVSGLRLTDHKNEIIFEQEPDPKKATVHINRELRYEGKRLVGYVDIYYSDTAWVRQRNNIVTIGISMVFGILLGSFLFINILLNRYLSKPLEDLQKDMALLEQGRFQPSNMVRQKIEIQNIIDAFNRLTISLRQREEEITGKTQGLKIESSERKQAEKINKALFAISNAVNTTQDLKGLYGSIHHSLSSIIDVTNFFIAMVDTKERTLYFPYHVDTVDDDFAPLTNFDADDSLTGLVVSQRRPVLLKEKELEKRTRQKGVWGPTPLTWMGTPLIVKDEVIGVVAVQSYINPNLFTEKDLQVLSMVSDQMAIAINRKRAADALQESEKKYRHLFKNAPAGIYEIDFEKGRFVNVNEIMCKYSGYSEEEFLSMNPLDLLAEDSKNLYLERVGKLSAGESLAGNVEYNIVKKDGQEVCVILNNDYIYKNGKLAGARVVTHDITELKKAEKEKLKAQKYAGEQKKLALVGQIAGKMAHDFNNILGIIMGNTELAMMDCKDEETRTTLELIFAQTIRGKNLTKNLVAFARDQEPKQEFFKINEKIDLVVNLLKKDLEGIELIKEDKPKIPDLLADAGMIEHALVNLIQNSIHATSMAEHPRIMIRTYCLDDNICFEIEDNGCGIAKEYVEKIYEPSFTLKGSKDTTGSYGRGIKGTGYGMANVKKYIEQHKGHISVDSEPGSGTKFTIQLPVIKKELTKEEKAEIQKEKLYFDKYILLVEDEPAISGVQYKILSQEPCNHKVDIANDGQAAMDLFDRNTYELVSLDYILPGRINGMDVYHHIRTSDKTIPILFISGNIEFLESIKELKQKDPHVDHLSKPCRNKDYVNRINELFKSN